LLDNWNELVIDAPTVYDKDVRYSVKYPNTFFLKVYENMALQPITQTADAGYIRRKQFFQIYGVYGSHDDAKSAIQEAKRIVTEKQGWYIVGKGSIQQSRRRFTFHLPCMERAYLQKGEW